MTKLLFLAYYFPPIGGGGVQRSLKFVKYLPEFGISPIVLTATPPGPSRWAPRDPELQQQFAGTTTVVRTPPIHAAEHSAAWEVRARNWLCLTSPFGLEWRRQAIEHGSAICRSEKPSAIFVTMSPFEGAEIGARLAQVHGLPWIADLRDPWALDEMQVYSSRFHRWMAKREMRHHLSTASVIVMNTPEAARRLREEFVEFRTKTVISLTNGFDAEDFARPITPVPREHFTLVHTGLFHTTSGRAFARRQRLHDWLGRSECGLDLGSRSHVHLLAALERLLDTAPRLAERVRVVFAGALSDADQAIVAASRARHLVSLPGYCTHPETLRLQRTADLLFLPMHTLLPGRRATVVPGKTYEYMASGRPILAAVPEGDARDFIVQSGTGFVCEPNDVSAMAAIIQSRVEAWLRHIPSPPTNRVYIQRFERRELTRQLAEQVVTLTQNRSASPAKHTYRISRCGPAHPLASAP